MQAHDLRQIARLGFAVFAIGIATPVAAQETDAGAQSTVSVDAALQGNPAAVDAAPAAVDAAPGVAQPPAKRPVAPPLTVDAAVTPDAAIADVSDGGPDVVDADKPQIAIDAGVAVDAGAAAPEAVDAAAAVDSVGPAKPSPKDRTDVIIKVIIGLSILFVLAYIGSHPKIRAFEEKIRVAHLVTAGFPFIALGLIARHPSVGVLTDDILLSLAPILNFGLGWLGFIIGIQLDVRFLDKLPRGTGYLVIAEASAPFVVTALACGGLMVAFGQDYRDPIVIRDALMLGAAGAMTGPLLGNALAKRPWTERTSDVGDGGIYGLVSQLDEIVGVACLLFIAAFFHPNSLNSTWELPGTAWVFVTLGLGVAVGIVTFVMVRVPKTGAEFLAVMLGFIAFASGLAGYLGLSPLVVCFIAGMLITNFPCEQRDDLMRLSARLERSIHLVFLIIAGALWSVVDWRGWVLVPCFILARIVGRWLGMTAGRKTFEAQDLPVPAPGPLITPLSVLAIALVVSVEELYAVDGTSQTLTWVMTAVIGGTMVSEILVQAVHFGEHSQLPGHRTEHADEHASDDLDELSEPAESSGDNAQTEPIGSEGETD